MQAVKAGSTIRGRSERWATRPSRDQVAAIARQHDDIRAVPIFREVMADLETPVSAYLKIRDSGPTFLLESIEGGSDWLATPLSDPIRSQCSRCAPDWRRWNQTPGRRPPPNMTIRLCPLST